jgi:gas vesicle protein
MPRKKRARVQSDSTIEISSLKEKGASAVDSDRIRSWANIQEELGKQIAQLIERQQRFYEEFSGKWTKVSTKMTETTGRATVSKDQLEDFRQAWDRHQQRITEHLDNLIKPGNEAVEALNAKWKELSEGMSNTVVSLSNITDMRRAQVKLFTAWTELSQEMNRQLARSIPFRDAWFEIVEGMDETAREFGEKDPSLTEAMKTWTDTSKEMNKDLMNHLDNSTEDIANLQTMWMHSISNITAELVRSVWSNNMRWFEENATKFPRFK